MESISRKEYCSLVTSLSNDERIVYLTKEKKRKHRGEFRKIIYIDGDDLLSYVVGVQIVGIFVDVTYANSFDLEQLLFLSTRLRGNILPSKLYFVSNEYE